MRRIIFGYVLFFTIVISQVFSGSFISDFTDNILDNRINFIVENMTIDEKIGQMIMISTNYTSFNQNIDDQLDDIKPGGVILFSQNIKSEEQLIKFIADLQDNVTIPLFIGVDEEGGRVERFNSIAESPLSQLPSMLDLGNTLDSQLSYQVGQAIASELSYYGVNLNFAPVLDVYSNSNNTVIGNRAFGTTSSQVIKMALPLARGLKSNNIIPVIKHFPGHGDTSEDSHVELPVVRKNLNELKELELQPFQAAINSGVDDAIMVAHIAYPEITGSMVPATLSSLIITDILREDMQFDGVIFTDSIIMKALSTNYTMSEIAVLGVNAGIDVFIAQNKGLELFDAIKTGVETGKIEEKTIDEAVKRVLKLKYKYQLFEEKDYRQVDHEANKEIFDKIIVSN